MKTLVRLLQRVPKQGRIHPSPTADVKRETVKTVIVMGTTMEEAAAAAMEEEEEEDQTTGIDPVTDKLVMVEGAG